MSSGWLTSFNLFAYCGNNPVARRDVGGNIWETVFDVITIGMSIADVVNNPTNGWAWAGLAGDVVDLIPVVTGVGEAIKALRTVDKIVDTVDGVGDAAKAAKYADEAAEALDIMDGACFVAGTVVLTSIGKVSIEDVEAGDCVWASDPETGEVALKRVVQTFINESNELIHVEIDGEEIVCTTKHPFYSPVKGWMAACELRAGDIFVSVNGDYVIVEKIQHEILESPIAVYNFEVEDFHTYYVGDTNVLVHNMCKLKNIYHSMKDAPNYNENFVKAQNGLKKVNVNNQELLHQLNQLGSGWKKVYQNGWINGQKARLHYFQDDTGKIFDFAIKYGRWS